MDGTKISGVAAYGVETILQGVVVAKVTPLAGKKCHVELDLSHESVRQLMASRLGAKQRRRRPGKPDVRSDD